LEKILRVQYIIKKFEKTYQEGSEVVMTLAEVFRQEDRKEDRRRRKELYTR